MPNSNLRSQVSEMLVGDGYRRHGRIHLLRVGEQISYWVDTGPLGQRFDIAPYVGIRHEDVELLRSRFFDQEPDKVRGTVGANVGYVTSGDYKSWLPPSKPSEVLDEVRSAIECLEQFTAPNRLLDAWGIRGAQAPGWRYAQIAAAVFLADRTRIAELLTETRAVECKQPDAICDQFRRFERRVHEYLE